MHLHSPQKENQRDPQNPYKYRKFDLVCAPTDKTNPTQLIQVPDYERWNKYQFLKMADLAFCPKEITRFEEANELIETVKFNMSSREEQFSGKSLATRAILYTKSLIKYHNIMNKKRKFPTRLVIPATNFISNLLKIGYHRIKKKLEKVNVNCSHVTIVQ